jgi:hypothetical protein
MKKQSNKSLKGHVVHNFFVHYDNAGTVYLISNIADTVLNNFAINVELIPNFINGYKDCTKYNINYFFNISKGLAHDILEDQIDYSKNECFLYEVPKLDLSFSDVEIKHDNLKSKWTMALMPHSLERLLVLGSVLFYVCKKNNPYFLISQFKVSYSDLTDGCINFDFKSDMELKLEELSIYTIKQFNTYCVTEVNNEKN